jgi:formiminoglutamate deiminase
VTEYWCELAWLGDLDGRVERGVAITIEGDRITNVTVDAPPSGVRLDGLTLPGMANAHSHAFHRALRGRTHAEAGTFWTWREQMYRLADRLDPDSYRRLATAAFAEMVLCGYTAVGEFHYLHHDRDGTPYSNPNEMGMAMFAAAAAAGIRLSLLDVCYLQADMTGASLQGTQRRFGDGDAATWVERVDQLRPASTARVGASIHSVRAVDPASMSVVAAAAAARGFVVHAHVSEQPGENAQCATAHGCTPLELLGRTGVLTDRFTAVHATHLGARDVPLLQGRAATCCVCPTTERDLADGIGPTATFRDSGIPVAIGSDSHAIVDPFEETRAVELDERLASLRRGNHRAGELLAMATANGYRSIGWPEGGRLAAGCLADMTTVRLTSPRLAGTDPAEAAAAVVFGATASDVSHVMVGGRTVVCDGAHQQLDVGASLDQSIRALWS